MKYILLLILFLGFGCEESSDDEKATNETNTPTNDDNDPSNTGGYGSLVLGDFAAFPSTTDPVTLSATPSSEVEEFDAAAGTLNLPYSLNSGNLIANISTGVSLGSSTSQSTFTGLNEAAFGSCEMVNRMRGLLHLAAAPEAVYCEVGFFLQNEDLFDGEFHILDVDEEEDGEAEEFRWKFKFEGTKEAPEKVTIYQCENGVQQTYLVKEFLADGSVKITSKRYSEPDNPSVDEFTSKTVVTGKTGDDGKFNDLKTIHQIYSNTFSNGVVSRVEEYAIQSSKRVQYSGIFKQDDLNGYDRFISYVDLIDNNTDGTYYDLTKLSLGEGAMVMSLASDTTRLQGWDATGELNNTLSKLDRLESLQNSFLTTPSDEVIAFTDEESWDCTGDPDFDITPAQAEAILEELEAKEGEGADFCVGYELPQNNHLECSQYSKLSSL